MGLHLHVLLLSKMNTSFFNVLAINKRKKIMSCYTLMSSGLSALVKKLFIRANFDHQHSTNADGLSRLNKFWPKGKNL